MPQATDPTGPSTVSAAPPRRHVFVYGTLRRGGANDITRLRPAPVFVGHARIEGVMHHLGAYPGVRLAPGAWVLGEVYAIEPALERQLDELEMILPEPTGEYLKREIPVRLGAAPGGTQAIAGCIVYEISPAHSAGRPVIASGDWIAGKDGAKDA